MDTATFYASRRHLPDWQAANWGSRESQELRWDILREAVPDDFYGSVLDVGCGSTRRFEHWWGGCLYTGIDLLNGRDVRNQIIGTDVVVASGLFGHNGSYDQMEQLVRHMWGLARKCLSFNTLSVYASRKDEGLFYADPLVVLGFCMTLTSKVVLRHDYLPHDFTVYMYR